MVFFRHVLWNLWAVCPISCDLDLRHSSTLGKRAITPPSPNLGLAPNVTWNTVWRTQSIGIDAKWRVQWPSKYAKMRLRPGLRREADYHAPQTPNRLEKGHPSYDLPHSASSVSLFSRLWPSPLVRLDFFGVLPPNIVPLKPRLLDLAVQCHLRSKVMVPVESPWSVSQIPILCVQYRISRHFRGFIFDYLMWNRINLGL